MNGRVEIIFAGCGRTCAREACINPSCGSAIALLAALSLEVASSACAPERSLT
jgi:hypothetical protein